MTHIDELEALATSAIWTARDRSAARRALPDLIAVARAAIPFAVREAQPYCCGVEPCSAATPSKRLLHSPCARCALRAALTRLNGSVKRDAT